MSEMKQNIFMCGKIIVSYDETIYNCFYEIEQLADICIRKLVAAEKFKSFLSEESWLGDPEIPLKTFIAKIKVIKPEILTLGNNLLRIS